MQAEARRDTGSAFVVLERYMTENRPVQACSAGGTKMQTDLNDRHHWSIDLQTNSALLFGDTRSEKLTRVPEPKSRACPDRL